MSNTSQVKNAVLKSYHDKSNECIVEAEVERIGEIVIGFSYFLVYNEGMVKDYYLSNDENYKDEIIDKINCGEITI